MGGQENGGKSASDTNKKPRGRPGKSRRLHAETKIIGWHEVRWGKMTSRMFYVTDEPKRGYQA